MDLRRSRPEAGPLWVQVLVWDIKDNRQEPGTSVGPSMNLGPLKEKAWARSFVVLGALEPGNYEAVDLRQIPLQDQFQARNIHRRRSRPGFTETGQSW